MRSGFQKAVLGFAGATASRGAALALNFAPAGASLGMGMGRKGPSNRIA